MFSNPRLTVFFIATLGFHLVHVNSGPCIELLYNIIIIFRCKFLQHIITAHLFSKSFIFPSHYLQQGITLINLSVHKNEDRKSTLQLRMIFRIFHVSFQRLDVKRKCIKPLLNSKRRSLRPRVHSWRFRCPDANEMKPETGLVAKNWQDRSLRS